MPYALRNLSLYYQGSNDNLVRLEQKIEISGNISTIQEVGCLIIISKTIIFSVFPTETSSNRETFSTDTCNLKLLIYDHSAEFT